MTGSQMEESPQPGCRSTITGPWPPVSSAHRYPPSTGTFSSMSRHAPFGMMWDFRAHPQLSPRTPTAPAALPVVTSSRAVLDFPVDVQVFRPRPGPRVVGAHAVRAEFAEFAALYRPKSQRPAKRRFYGLVIGVVEDIAVPLSRGVPRMVMVEHGVDHPAGSAHDRYRPVAHSDQWRQAARFEHARHDNNVR